MHLKQEHQESRLSPSHLGPVEALHGELRLELLLVPETIRQRGGGGGAKSARKPWRGWRRGTKRGRHSRWGRWGGAAV